MQLFESAAASTVQRKFSNTMLDFVTIYADNIFCLAQLLVYTSH